MKQIIIYGIGVNCNTFIRYAKHIDFEIVAFVDRNKVGLEYENMIVISPDDICRLHYDEIFLTIGEGTEKIKAWLLEELGISEQKIVCPSELNKRYMLQDIQGAKYNFIMPRTQQYEILYKDIYSLESVNICGLLLCNSEWYVSDSDVEVMNYQSILFVLFMYGMDEKFLGYLKHKYVGIKIAVLFNDMISGEYGYERVFPGFSIEKLREKADVLVTYHKAEAEQYKLHYHMQNFSKLNIPANEIKSDLFFVGVAKNRLDFLHAVYRFITKAGGKCEFWISGVREEDQLQNHEGIIYNQRLSYEEYLRKMCTSKCILEAIQEGDVTSVRYCEAIVYNKKLLVNDSKCKDYIFYNEENIKIINSVEDIDVNWITDNKTINYAYNNEFSPKHMVHEIEDLFYEDMK